MKPKLPDDLTIVVACMTNTGWSTTVTGSKGDLYTVRWCFQPRGQYDYECTCPSYVNRGTHCKHIRQVINEKRRCGWSEERTKSIFSWLQEMIEKRGKCPRCGGPVMYAKVGG
jgi:hypothetical protein